MHLSDDLHKRYTKEQFSALEAQRMAEIIAWGPVVFQASRIMLKWGIFDYIRDSRNGLTIAEISEKAKQSEYAIKCLLEASLSIGTVLIDTESERFFLSKIGYFLSTSEATKANLWLNHHINYEGMFCLEESFVESKPMGLKHFGDWKTIYEGLSSLPEEAQKSWFTFDHFYSDNSFPEALKIVFDEYKTKKLYDIGGNTGKWALQCIEFCPEAEVTVFDLPQQIALLEKNIEGKSNKHKITGQPINWLDPNAKLPKQDGLDAIWMSQFLDCFSEAEIQSILERTKEAMEGSTRLFIMETLWDRQRFETAAFCLTMTSLYFTAIANGNSKMYHSEDLIKVIKKSGLQVERIYDNIGLGHSILVCKK